MSEVQEMVLPASSHSPDLEHGALLYIGTATILLRYAGLSILTDPNFLHQGEQVHLGYGLRSTRKTNPAISLEELPPVDLVILSHLHEDHFDRLVEHQLDRAIPILTTPQAAAALHKKGFAKAHALDIWQTISIFKGETQLRLTAMPGKHAPGLLSSLLPPVMGSMLEFLAPADQLRLRLYISGDTLVHQGLKEIPRRYPEIDLALLHLGGTRLLGVLVTMDDRQGVEALKLIAPRLAIPIHYEDYPVFKSPLGAFMKAVAAAGLSQQVQYLYSGERYTFEATESR